MGNIKIKYSKYIPFKGFYMCQLFGTIYIRKKYEGDILEEKDINHEAIHNAQALDFGIGKLGYILFYILYGLEWLIKWPLHLSIMKSYEAISFEREAYNNESNLEYLNERKRWSWIKRIFK